MKFNMITLGCPKNRVDSEVMFGSLLKHEYEYTSDPKEAELIVVNSCSFIESAKQESIDTILDLSELKETAQLKKLVVAGCLAQRYQKQVEELLPEVDHFIGTGEYYKIASIIESEKRGNYSIPSYIHTYESPRINSMPSYTAYLKLTEGCNRKCAFCIIPTIRGKQKSQSIENLVQEAKILTEQGTTELNLIGQDLTAYGTDLKDGKTKLEALLKELVKIDKLNWMRLLYCYPDHITDEFMNLLKNEEKICSYIDMPLQHIDNDMLISMRRGVNERRVKSIIEKIRSTVPNIVFRTSFIAGYPGETDQQFDKLYDFVKEMAFDHVGVFTYSQEEGTAAADMAGQVPKKVMKQRKDALMMLQAEISRKKLQSKVGDKIDVLVEGWDEEKELYRGRYYGQAPDIDGYCYINKLKGHEYSAGSYMPSIIEKSFTYDVICNPV